MPATLVPPVLTPDRLSALEEQGLVCIPGAIPQADVTEMSDRLWQALGPATKGAAETWTVERPSGFTRLTASGAFDAVASPTVRGALDELLGEWIEPKAWGPPLVAFPAAAPAWALPHQAWHFDSHAYPGRGGLRRLGRVFAILSPLQTHGGATLVAQGSHILAEAEADRAGRELTSAEVRERLRRRHPWFADLAARGPDPDRTRRFMDETTLADGAALRVVEMTGEPGDVWLMHPNCLHAGSPNVLKAPRLVVTQWVSTPTGRQTAGQTS